MRTSSALVLLAGIVLALGGCTGGNRGGSASPAASDTAASKTATSSPTSSLSTSSTGGIGAPSQDPASSSTHATAAPTTATLSLYFIAEHDSGVSGPAVGCGDSAVAVKSAPVTYTDPVQAALQTLLDNHSKSYGQSGLLNALWQSAVAVSSVERSGTSITAHLTGTLVMGGECDIPRVEAQLLLTAKQAAGAPVAITLNGQPLSAALSLK
ncbi:hypothetical protein [Arthrobacter psychrochitiniphilus]|uniref:hypothetical protein n=1 Tax=Arthrobacter psychrochitiniphilus TaxID=291045 RepID=UPI0011B5D3E2|nr:hypothetical protein [Arthrobacter psychrochitiniphilus]NYG15537.1 hypothetical protein [Arthrobacter psychrochitiniphilus]